MAVVKAVVKEVVKALFKGFVYILFKKGTLLIVYTSFEFE